MRHLTIGCTSMTESGDKQTEQSLYYRVGGGEFFTDLVDRFYLRVITDEMLRPMYPEDLNPGKANLAAFLVQYWGGPSVAYASCIFPYWTGRTECMGSSYVRCS